MKKLALYDNIKMVLEFIKTPQRFWQGLGKVEIWKGLKWIPVPSKTKDKVAYYMCFVENLYIKLYAKKATCKNSIHRFAIGNNYRNYTIAEFISGINKLNNLTGFNWWNARIVKLEFGINCKTNSEAFYTPFDSYKCNEYVNMTAHNGSLVYGRNCVYDEYRIKIYNKTLQIKIEFGVKIHFAVTRIEILASDLSYMRNRKNPISIYLVSDLINPLIIRQLNMEIKEKICGSTRNPKTDYSKYDATELRIIAAYENKTIFKELQKRSRRNAKALRLQYQRLMEL